MSLIAFSISCLECGILIKQDLFCLENGLVEYLLQNLVQGYTAKTKISKKKTILELRSRFGSRVKNICLKGSKKKSGTRIFIFILKSVPNTTAVRATNSMVETQFYQIFTRMGIVEKNSVWNFAIL